MITDIFGPGFPQGIIAGLRRRLLVGQVVLAIAGTAFSAADAESSGGWKIDAATSSTVSINSDQITISGPQNVHAMAWQPAPAESAFRFSARIRAPEAAQLAPALFIYWTPDNWVRIGHSGGVSLYHVHGPGIYGVICEGGKQKHLRLTGTSSRDFRYNPDLCTLEAVPVAEQWQQVGLSMDQESIKFLIGEPSTEWRVALTNPRSGVFKQKPARVVLGKGNYEAGHFTASVLANDLPDAGPVVTAEFQAVEVAGIDPDDEALALREVDDASDDPGIGELAKPGDPMFDSVASHWPALQYTQDAIGVADHPDEFVVLPNGVLLAAPNEQLHPGKPRQRAWFAVGSDGARFGGETTVSRQLLEGWLPVLTCGWQHDGLQYEQTVAAWSEGMSPDKPMVGLVRMRVVNPGDAETTTQLALYSEAQKRNVVSTEIIVVAPHSEATAYFKVPFPAEGQPITASILGQERYDLQVAEVASAWRDRISTGMQIDIPEERVMNAWRAWQCWQLICVDKVNGAYEYHDGASFYELVYGFSASRAAQQADYLNRQADARKWIDAMLNMGTPEGQFIINYGLSDHGSLLNAVAHHYDYSHDKEWLKKVEPTLVKMCEWARDERVKSKAGLPTTSPVYGMISARPYCDHPAPGYYLPGDMLLANGMMDTARILKEIDSLKDAEWIEAEARAYITDLRRVIDNSIFEVDGQDLLPLFPATRELLEASSWQASNYYALLSPLLLEEGGEVIPPDSRPAQLVRDALEQRGGLLMGVPRFWGGIDHAYGGSYWSYCLAHNEPEKALLALYSSMAYGMSRDTFASVEVTFCKDGKNFPTLPHNFSNLEQLRLLRNMLVMEQGDALVLGSGIARHWLAKGKHLEVKDAATRWGTVSYQVDIGPDARQITAKLTLPPQLPSGGVKLMLRHAESIKLKQAMVKGADLAEKGEDYLVLKNPVGPVEVEATY